MDIGALSMGLNQSKIYQQVNTSVLKMAMDSSEMQTEELLKMLEANTKIMEQMMIPHLGANVDVKA
jgi:hypothetical protein